ncbi:mgtE-like transporter [Methanococcoides vulcani]|uniref:MgtE-like transporter n=1 Tax=Methanococcoides vulcani TaxID=1353158 RepID=A0A1H9ZVQ0_9EURY|nr:magnesium transporter [Methanococcoides vulcani]SES85415.1 mgtE-like transporter [Methanococcoides vulcani]
MSYYTIRGIINRGLPILFLTSLLGLTAGQMLNSQLDNLIAIPTILLLIPALIKIGGDTGSMLGARLASAFHMGIGTTHIQKNPVVKNSVIAAFIVGMSASVVLSIIAWIIGSFVGNGFGFFTLFKICTISSMFELLAVFSATIAIAFASHKFGIDPDDTVIPIIATLGDLVGITAIFVTLHLMQII